MIRILIGDILQSNAQAIVNTINCVGVMGKGIAAEFKAKFPAMYKDYKSRCDAKQVRLGEPYLFIESGVSIINFPTKNHWRSPSNLDDIISGLDYLIEHLSQWNINSIAIPPLGCGNGGLEWTVVGPIIYQKFSKLPVSVEIYAPYGVSQNQLTQEFFQQDVLVEKLKGREQQKINPSWFTLLEVISQLSQQPHANAVGRTIFQKIAYILTEQGVDTGFQFAQASYGPFSSDMMSALKVFTNTNLIKEQMLGKMMAISVGSNYLEFKNKYQSVLDKYAKQIEKTVDLFSRIKNTQQAEEVTTVLFSARKLKKEKSAISEQELYDFIIKWKKNWNTEDKHKTIAKTIRNLEMLGWVRLQYSESMFVEQ